MADENILRVLILTPQRIIFEGKASAVILPGEQGVFEILPHHKRILSRLLEGYVIVDNKNAFAVRRGVAKADKNEVTIIVEEK